jgi:hypothetical protein
MAAFVRPATVLVGKPKEELVFCRRSGLPQLLRTLHHRLSKEHGIVGRTRRELPELHQRQATMSSLSVS